MTYIGGISQSEVKKGGKFENLLKKSNMIFSLTQLIVIMVLTKKYKLKYFKFTCCPRNDVLLTTSFLQSLFF